MGGSRRAAAALPLAAGPAPGCGVPEASSSCTGDTAARSTASASAAGWPPPPPASAADTPSAGSATPASPSSGSSDSRSAPVETEKAESLVNPSAVTAGMGEKTSLARFGPPSAGPCVGGIGVSASPVNWSVLSSAGPEYAAGTSSLLLEPLWSKTRRERMSAAGGLSPFSGHFPEHQLTSFSRMAWCFFTSLSASVAKLLR